MKPVLVLQHMSDDGPAHFAEWLGSEGVAFEVFDTELGAVYPHSMSRYGALAVLGGAMSANDPLPSLRQAQRLILEAMSADLPVLGLCLGGQLMARALGGEVTASPVPEVGWHRIDVLPGEPARSWFGGESAPVVFQWHFESFSLPDGATLLAGNAACPNQAFAIGRHLALQFHVEIDEHKLAAWAASRDPTYLQFQQVCDTVHGAPRIRREATAYLALQERLAQRLFRRWLRGADDFRIGE